MMAAAPPFPVLVIGYAIDGFGIALEVHIIHHFSRILTNDRPSGLSGNWLRCRLRGWCENEFPSCGVWYEIFIVTKTNPYFLSGVGALSAPLIATRFAQMPRWPFQYLTSLGLSIANVTALVIVFKLKTQDGIPVNEILSPRTFDLVFCPVLLEKNGHPPAEASTSQHSTLRQILSIPAIYLLSFFILVYVGVEVTIGGMLSKGAVTNSLTVVFQQAGLSPSLSTKEEGVLMPGISLVASLGVCLARDMPLIF